mgnify:CR=1 FL=1
MGLNNKSDLSKIEGKDKNKDISMFLKKEKSVKVMNMTTVETKGRYQFKLEEEKSE